MAAGDLSVFQEATAYLIDGGFEGTDSIKVALITNAVVPTSADPVPGMAVGATTQYTDCSEGGNYSAGGETLDTLANMITETAGAVTFDDTGASFTIAQDASNPTDARYAIIYNSTDTAQRAIAWIDLGQTVDLTAGSLTITWNASGIFTIAPA